MVQNANLQCCQLSGNNEMALTTYKNVRKYKIIYTKIQNMYVIKYKMHA